MGEPDANSDSDARAGSDSGARVDRSMITSPVQGRVLEVRVGPGDRVAKGMVLAVIESMKMHHDLVAPAAAMVMSVSIDVGAQISAGTNVMELRFVASIDEPEVTPTHVDLALIRDDLDRVLSRHRAGLDAGRPDAVRKVHSRGRRTARENVEDLIDDGSFIEYGPLVIAAQRRRRSEDDLIAHTPADGLIGGIATIGVDRVGPERARVVVMSYDYTVLAGTQGHQNHRKKDRLFELAERQRLPVVLFAEGGGGRPGDTDTTVVSGLDTMAFYLFGRLSGTVPLVGIASGRCFAGNAALLGCCDVIIATEDANIGMGGPAMISGGGLGEFAPEDIGPIDTQHANGVVDIRVADDAEAVDVARRYLTYFQDADATARGSAGTTTDSATTDSATTDSATTDGAANSAADQRDLRHLIPENRLQVYNVRAVVETLVDTDSHLELRAGFAPGMITSLARIDGRPVAILANDPAHLGGAIDTEGADKAARFLQMCDAHGLPVLFLCDTPGFMVGPASEAAAAVRHMSRLFVTGANLSVPCATVILRKAYGLGAQAMAAGSFKAPEFVVAWPTGELGGMGLEGAVRLGFRAELDAERDAEARQRLFDSMVELAYTNGRAANVAAQFEIDDVIDPADTRRWIITALLGTSTGRTAASRRRPNIDTW
ncbi:carboxyl transferase domain-containing protein [Candidatus Neomicrothrix sp.]|uniref:carboxyl transferase domain-containing protein n=3 Tax=Candidatus Neomicrothrix sp. TaxID=2719034 RepID=UPI001B69730F|nr:carboxyl transferase domain-containing protein [Candidatus Microthrix sp.]MBL0205850.1 biotin carboxylase [Candidatus Microthrix sp.]MBP6135245.1 biotin carboxylase [Candidatus Microthrix sp.]MBP6149794.1 biotin carboxylase [Candidatus Microthrix sp.]MBP7994242.1 biotin carboxylase [Candidatus Microthrix sp.]MBP9834266.1 biotin carboxylase [Candidatus Microthrix sp.]